MNRNMSTESDIVAHDERHLSRRQKWSFALKRRWFSTSSSSSTKSSIESHSHSLSKAVNVSHDNTGDREAKNSKHFTKPTLPILGFTSTKHESSGLSYFLL